MKQIYDFEQYHPPALNEAALREELDRRRMNRAIALFAFLGILMQIFIILIGVLTAETAPMISASCFLLSAVSSSGSGIVAFAYTWKGDVLYE